MRSQGEQGGNFSAGNPPNWRLLPSPSSQPAAMFLAFFFAVSAKLLFPPGGFERHARAFFYLWHVVQHALQPIGLAIEERAGTSPGGRERNSRANSSFLSCATSNINLGPLFLPLFEFYPWQASKRVFFLLFLSISRVPQGQLTLVLLFLARFFLSLACF